MAFLGKALSWRDSAISAVTLCGTLIYYAGQASASYSCTETKELFEDVKEKLDTELPIELSPVFFSVGAILPVIFVIKTIRDVVIYRRQMRYIESWEMKHLGPLGQKNEVIMDYPETKPMNYVLEPQEEDEKTDSADDTNTVDDDNDDGNNRRPQSRYF